MGEGLGTSKVRSALPRSPSGCSFSLVLTCVDRSLDSKDTSIVRTYVLPDFVPTSNNKLGYLRIPPTGLTPPPSPPPTPPPMEEIVPGSGAGNKGKGKEKVVEEEQLLQMNNERFSVPEVVFNPSSIG